MDKKLMLLIFVFLLVFATFTGSLFLAKQDRAVRAAKRIAIAEKSLCLSASLSAKLGESAQVTCVARDAETNAVSGAQCCFTVTSGSGVAQPNCSITDENGMAKTVINATTAGISQINCQINGSINAGSVSVAFNQ